MYTIEACNADNARQNPENAREWMLPVDNTAVDNIDGVVTDRITIGLFPPTCAAYGSVTAANCPDAQYFTQKNLEGQDIPINTFILGAWHILYTVDDKAGMFGENGENNVAEAVGHLHIEDTTAPDIYCKAVGLALGDANYDIKAELKELFAVNQILDAPTIDACGQECEMQQWMRTVGAGAPANTSVTAPACTFFSWNSATHKCHLVSDKLITLSGNVVASSNWQAGYPIQCEVKNIHECGTEYVDPGARCIDMHDSWEFGYADETADTIVNTTAAGIVNTTDLGNHLIEYTCKDKSNNGADKANKKDRFVDVVDTTKPVIWAHGSSTIEHSAGHTADMQYINDLQTADIGYTCTDSCEGMVTSSVRATWHKDSCDGVVEGFETLIPGTYFLKYSCKDSSLNNVTKCKTIVNIDEKIPIINIHGVDDNTIEAICSDSDIDATQYVELGATCSDQVDGWISGPQHQTITTPVPVRYDTPGTYYVHYDCMDNSSNTAARLTRTILVQDTTCPTCQPGDSLTIEASFPYTDQPPACTDSFSPDYSQAVGGSCSAKLNTTSTFSRQGPNGAPALTPVNVELTGSYYITYTSTDVAGNRNDVSTCSATGETVVNGSVVSWTGQNTAPVRTIVVVDTLTPVISLRYKHPAEQTGQPTDHFSGKLIQTGAADDKGARGESNPAHYFNYTDNSYKAIRLSTSGAIEGHYYGNPQLEPGWTRKSDWVPKDGTLMAESTVSSSNAWIAAAVASGVTGLALLGYSQKKMSTITVPV